MSLHHPTEKQSKIIWSGLSALALTLIIAFLGLLGWGFVRFLEKLSSVLMPMALAVILAYVLEPVVQFFERMKLSRFRSVSLVFILTTVLLIISASLILPDLLRQSRNLARDLPRNVAVLHTKMQTYFEKTTWLQNITKEFSSGEDTATETNNIAPPLSDNSEWGTASPPATNNVPPVSVKKDSHSTPTNPALESIHGYMVIFGKWLVAQLTKVTTLAEFLIGFVLVPVYLFYFLLEKEVIEKNWQKYIPITNRTIKKEVVFVMQSINDCMLVFFRGQVLVALCVGFLLATSYTFMGLRYSVLLGVVAGILGIVPYLGTVISLTLALLVVATQFGDWYHAFLVLGIAGMVKLLEDIVISPKIVGERSGLHPLATIVAVLVGSTLLGGFLGALVAIPLTATLRAIMDRYFWEKSNDDSSTSTE